MEIELTDPSPYHYCIWQNYCRSLAEEANIALDIIETNFMPSNHHIKSYEFSSIDLIVNLQYNPNRRFIFHFIKNVRHGSPNSLPIQ